MSVCAALSGFGCGPLDNRACSAEGQLVQPDDEVQGHRIGDLLEPYFGAYQGTLHWEIGESTPWSLDLSYRAPDPYMLSNVYACEARDVGYWSPARVVTGDGAIDNDLPVDVYRNFPEAGLGAVPESVVSFSAIADWQWQPSLRDKIAVDTTRYIAPYVVFTLEWPVDQPAPLSGTLTLSGELVVSPGSYDQIQVATVTF